MARNNGHHSADPDVIAVRDLLQQYKSEHRNARIEVKRQNSVAIRARIIDPDFATMNLVDRDERIWKMLSSLPSEIQSQITMVLLLTPQEASDSFANLEFEHPLSSKL